jgi:hypothetical protein
VTVQEKVGFNIRKYRKLKKISQEKLAEYSNLHRTYISSIERGLKSPSLDVIEKISNILQVDIKNLFE